MKFSRILLAAFLLVLTVPTAKAQMNIGPLKLDPSFANNGKSEVDFEGFNDDATCFLVNLALNRILVAGKIYTSTPGEIRFGVVEYDASGMLDSGFGTNGKADLSWNGIDYANAIDLLPDGSVLGTGATGTGSTFGQFVIAPALFRLKPDGTSDSSFGAIGKVFGFEGGEFETIDTLHIGTGDSSMRYVATGYGTNDDSDLPGPVGFCAMRLNASGEVDSAFGSGGREFVEALITSAQGHLIDGGGILFAGLSRTQYPEIILCKLQPNGTPDSSFGTNGVLNTGIALHGGDQIHSVYDPANPSDTSSGILVAAPIADSSAMLPFTMIKFKLDGTLDSNYGKNGIATAPVISSMKIYGISPPNAKGYTHLCGGIGNVSATVQFFGNGVIDSTFGTNGIALMDADSGLRKNFLTGFTPAGSKHFIGVGTSVNEAGNDDFLVARYIPGIAGVSQPKSDNSQAIQLYPNPSHGFVQVEVQNVPIQQISIVDALGRIVLSFERPHYAANSNSYFLDVSGLPNGTYNCTIRTTEGTSSQRFTEIH